MNEVDIVVTSHDQTEKGFKSAERGAKSMADRLSRALSGLVAIGAAAGADLASSLAGPLVAAAGTAAAAFASAGAAVGAFGLAVQPQAKAIGELTKLWDAYDQAAAGSEERAAAWEEYAAALNELPPATQAAAGEFIALRDSFQMWSDSLAGDTMPVVTKGLMALKEALPALTPLVKAGAAALSDFMDSILRGIRSGGLAKFTGELADAARSTLPSLLRSLKNVGSGFAGILSAFLPFSDDMAGGIENLTEKFAEFGQSLGDNPAFQEWMAEMMDQGPEILDLFGDLVQIFLNVAEALAPFTGLTLKVTAAFADLIAAIPQDVMDWLAPAVMGIVLAVKAWSVAQGILNVVLMANPIGLIIGLVAGLAAGLVIAYQKSETFRDIVDGAFRFVKDAASEAWDYIQPALERMGELLGEELPEAAGILTEALAGVAEDAQNLAEKIFGINDRLGETKEEGEGVKGWFEENWQPVIGSIIAGPLGAAVGLAEQHLETTKKVFTESGGALKEEWQGIWNTIGDTVRTAMFWIGDNILKGIGTVGHYLLAFFPDLQEKWDEAWDKVAGIARRWLRKISDWAGWLSRRIGGMELSWDGIWSGLEWAYNYATGLLSSLWDYASSITSDIGSMVWGAISSIPGFADGGISHAAEGGPRGNMVMVGERGRELVRLPFGSTVIPNGQTENMLAGGGGGGATRVQAEWVGGNAGDSFMEWLKENIRITAGTGEGSVQQALGWN